MSSNVKWRGEPLPRGRHKLAAEAVRNSQRARIVRAMLECVGRDGYEATTVPQVVATARVSRNAFYEFFADKADCFIAACDEAAQELLRGEDRRPCARACSNANVPMRVEATAVMIFRLSTTPGTI